LALLLPVIRIESMPFHRDLPGVGFDPETVSLLATAFSHALRRAHSNGFLGEEEATDRTRTLIANLIMDAAVEGERDVNRLVDRAIAALLTALSLNLPE
jgi:hypothetical protein